MTKFDNQKERISTCRNQTPNLNITSDVVAPASWPFDNRQILGSKIAETKDVVTKPTKTSRRIIQYSFFERKTFAEKNRTRLDSNSKLCCHGQLAITKH